MKVKIKKIGLNLLTMMVSFGFALGVVELVLRLANPSSEFLTHANNLDYSVPSISILPGLADSIHVSTNAQGYKSKYLFSDDRYGILTIGGSTTECIGLSNSDSWPYLLEEKLNKSGLSKNLTVGNIGKSGSNAAHNFLHLKHMLPQFHNVNMVLVLVGINDFGRFLQKGKYYEPTVGGASFYKDSFWSFPLKYSFYWHEKLELWIHLRRAKNFLFEQFFQIRRNEEMEAHLVNVMNQYVHAKRVYELPDMSEALEDYKENLLLVIDQASEYGIELVFITQPVFWKESMSEQEIKYAAMVPGNAELPVYDISVLSECMAVYNETLIEMANAHDVDVIDLASVLPRDTSVFFDYCHYNVRGSKEVSNHLFEDIFPIIERELQIQ